MDLAATVLAFLDELARAFSYELGARRPAQWLLFMAPLVLMELPHHYLPVLGTMVAHLLGHPRVDADRRRAFLERKPRVSVVVAGRNEGATIEALIRSLLGQELEPYEIIVVDDSSDDAMPEVAARFARRGLVRYVRNAAPVGRSGRPGATNLGMRLANGDFIVSLDADTTFDRGMLRHLIAPFADPGVGVVAGNVLVRNSRRNLLTRLQTLEYLVSIDLHKRWASLFGRTLQASGAIGAFRRRALLEIRGWDQELAEDGDISLRMVKDGWRIAFAPHAVSLTEVPLTWRALARQRTRWDRGGFRAYFAKHGRLLLPSVAGASFAYGMWAELLFSVVATLAYPVYLAWLLTQGLFVLLFVMLFCGALYTALSVLPLLAIPLVNERIHKPLSLLAPALLTPLYKEGLRWVRVKAIVMELLRVRYEDPFLPDSAWRHAPRF